MTAEEPFIYGLEYTVKKSPPSSKDTESFFIPGTRLIYFNYTAYWVDRGEYSHSELHFYNDETGCVSILKFEQPKELKEFRENNFELTGGWPHPMEGEIIPVDPTQFDLSDRQKLLQSFFPYFKSILEGDKHVENWYYWIGRHILLLQKIMNPMEVLKLKTDSFSEMKKYLDQNNITYQIGLRYKWLSKNLLYPSKF